MQIEIWSDVVCPWCFIGKKRLDEALALTPDVAVEVRVGPRDKRRDLDNFAKGPLDLLQAHGIVANDRNVVDLRISWAPDVKGCEITITSREG